MDNVQKLNTCNNIPSSQTFKSQFIRLLEQGSCPRKAATNTGQHKHRKNIDIHPCLECDSTQGSQCLSRRRHFMPYTARPLWSAIKEWYFCIILFFQRDGYVIKLFSVFFLHRTSFWNGGKLCFISESLRVLFSSLRPRSRFFHPLEANGSVIWPTLKQTKTACFHVLPSSFH
jgi:hypothetical protein